MFSKAVIARIVKTEDCLVKDENVLCKCSQFGQYFSCMVRRKSFVVDRLYGIFTQLSTKFQSNHGNSSHYSKSFVDSEVEKVAEVVKLVSENMGKRLLVV